MSCSGSPSSPPHGGDRHQTASVESTGEGFGRVQQIGVRQLSTDSADNPRISADAALERRLATGRESQRRFRERQKARAQEVERELSKATTELFQLRNRQAELEARNMLLEGLRSEEDDTSQQAAPGLNLPEADAPNPRGILVLVSQPPYCLTVEEASKLTIPAFSALWTEHVRQLGRLLLQIGDPSASNVQDAVAAMQALAVEAFKLILCLLHNPVTNQALVASRLDDGSPAVNPLNDEFYNTLLDLIGLTDDQIQDIIIIRHVYLTRRSSLDRQRKATVEQMGKQELEDLHPSDSFAALSLLAEQAHDITAQDFQAYCAVISGLYQGVLSTQQVAGVMVHAYPFLPMLVKTLDAVAARGGVQDLNIPPAVLEDPEQLAVEWGKFEAYVAKIQTQVWHDYVPLVVSCGQDVS